MNKFDKLTESILNEEYTYDTVAKMIPAGLDSESEILSAASKAMKKEWGNSKASYYMRDEDFPMEIIMAYKELHNIKKLK